MEAILYSMREGMGSQWRERRTGVMGWKRRVEGTTTRASEFSDKLESPNGMKRETKKKRIAAVEFGGNESIGKENCGRAIENRADLTKLANVIERRRANGRDMLVER